MVLVGAIIYSSRGSSSSSSSSSSSRSSRSCLSLAWHADDSSARSSSSSRSSGTGSGRGSGSGSRSSRSTSSSSGSSHSSSSSSSSIAVAVAVTVAVVDVVVVLLVLVVQFFCLSGFYLVFVGRFFHSCLPPLRSEPDGPSMLHAFPCSGLSRLQKFQLLRSDSAKLVSKTAASGVLHLGSVDLSVHAGLVRHTSMLPAKTERPSASHAPFTLSCLDSFIASTKCFNKASACTQAASANVHTKPQMPSAGPQRRHSQATAHPPSWDASPDRNKPNSLRQQIWPNCKEISSFGAAV